MATGEMGCWIESVGGVGDGDGARGDRGDGVLFGE